ncbi:hypothetical protein K8942_03550 [Candidatus Peribacteria bacterium]|nr:MAG: hypothetical protein K8942_03550 [Candidatus Peribacteria bacterium]
MNLNLTRQWFDAVDESITPEPADASPPLQESLYLSQQLGLTIGECRWEALDAWREEANKRPSAFSTMALAIISSVREAAKKVSANGQIFLPGEWTVLRERMNGVIDADPQMPAFAEAVTALAEELQPALLNTMMVAPQGYGSFGLKSSLRTMSGTVASGISALAPKSSKTGMDGIMEDQANRNEPLIDRDPRAIVFDLLSEVAQTIFIVTGEMKAYFDRNDLIGEPLPPFETWPERVRKNPLPVSVE